MSKNAKYPCPVCGEKTLDGEATHDTCSVCGWEDERYQREHPDEKCANGD